MPNCREGWGERQAREGMREIGPNFKQFPVILMFEVTGEKLNSNAIEFSSPVIEWIFS